MQVQEEEHAEQYAISVPEAARRLSISVRHAWDLVHEGELPTVRFGRSVRVPVPALIQMLSLPKDGESDDGEEAAA